MKKFKPGDVVLCLTADYDLVFGKKYEVLDEEYDEELGEFISVDDSSFWFSARRFKMFEDDFEGNV
jgi:hypothetical protein